MTVPSISLASRELIVIFWVDPKGWSYVDLILVRHAFSLSYQNYKEKFNGVDKKNAFGNFQGAMRR